MQYTYEYSEGNGYGRLAFDPVRIEVKWQNQHRMIVHPSTREKRAQLVEYLEKNGFTYGEQSYRDREWMLTAGLPLSIDFNTKTFITSGNVTNAACAASQKAIAPEWEFHRICGAELEG